MSLTYLQMIVKQRLVSTLRLQSGKADNARLHTGDKVIGEACGSLSKSLKIYKRAKKQQPFISTNCYTLAIHCELKDQCEGCWPDPNVAIQKQSHQNAHRTPGFHTLESSTKIHFRKAVMSLYNLWPRPSIIQHAVSPSCVWKTCMTDEYQLNTGVNF